MIFQYNVRHIYRPADLRVDCILIGLRPHRAIVTLEDRLTCEACLIRSQAMCNESIIGFIIVAIDFHKSQCIAEKHLDVDLAWLCSEMYRDPLTAIAYAQYCYSHSAPRIVRACAS